MLESELLQTSLTASFVLCTQLSPLNSSPMTGPKEEKQSHVHSYITTLALVAWIFKEFVLNYIESCNRDRAGSLNQTEQFYKF